MNYKAVIFDLDGTLVHTEPECIHKMIGQAFQDFGIKLSDQETERFWFDAARDDFVKRLGIDVKSFWTNYMRYDTPEFRMKHMKPYQDAVFLNEIKRKGCKMGIVTGAPFHVISISMKMLGKGLFDSAIRAKPSSGIRPKPDPHGIDECLKSLGVCANQAIFVGNGGEDVTAARAAGVFDVLIERGEHEPPKETPSLKIKSLYELRDLLGF